jgi:imidazolonepropionase-like amidohydrolase
VKPGGVADLVLLAANPLNDIQNTKKINAVIINGRFLDRAALDHMLTQVEASAKAQK